MMNKLIVKILVPLVLLIGICIAPSAVADKGLEKALKQHLFRPDLIVKHSREIGLTREQRRQLIGIVRQLRGDIVDLELNVLEAGDDLIDIVSQAQVDVDKALQKVDEITRYEGQMKRKHLELWVRVKNLLTAEQIERLQRWRQRQKTN